MLCTRAKMQIVVSGPREVRECAKAHCFYDMHSKEAADGRFGR